MIRAARRTGLGARRLTTPSSEDAQTCWRRAVTIRRHPAAGGARATRHDRGIQEPCPFRLWLAKWYRDIAELRILQAIEIDYIDEQVLSPADDVYHIDKSSMVLCATTRSTRHRRRIQLAVPLRLVGCATNSLRGRRQRRP